jgi:hypothetical protein
MGYYWEHNKIYVIITITIFIVWLILLGIMFIDIHIEISTADNDTCTNPIAMFFDKANREKCLRLAADKKSKIVKKITKTFDKNVDAVIKKTRDVKNEIKMTNDYFDGLLVRKEAERTKKMEYVRGLYNEVYNLVNKIRNDYKENQDGLVKLVDYYQNTFEYNQKIMAELASQLVKKLVANTFTKRYDTQRENMVKSYDKITQFLAAFSKESVPELPSDARRGRK